MLQVMAQHDFGMRVLKVGGVLSLWEHPSAQGRPQKPQGNPKAPGAPPLHRRVPECHTYVASHNPKPFWDEGPNSWSVPGTIKTISLSTIWGNLMGDRCLQKIMFFGPPF